MTDFFHWIMGMDEIKPIIKGWKSYKMAENSIRPKIGLFLSRIYMIFHIPFCDYCKRPGLWEAYKFLVFGVFPKE